MIQASPQNNYLYNKELKPLAKELRNSMTKAECCLWKYVLKAKKMKGFQFTRQRPVLNYIADFMCKDLLLIIEVDGISHQFNEIEIKDTKKQAELEKVGFTVLRFRDSEILNNIGDVIRVIENYVDQNINHCKKLNYS